MDDCATMNAPISADALRRALVIAEQIEALQAQYNAILSGTTVPARRGRKPAAVTAALNAAAAATPVPVSSGTGRGGKGKKRKLSPEARERIRAAVKARWARQKAGK